MATLFRAYAYAAPYPEDSRSTILFRYAYPTQFYSVTHTRHNYIPVCIPGGFPEYSDPLRGDFLTEVVIYHTCIRAGGRAPPGLIPSQHSRCACACASLVFNRGRDLLSQELRAIMEKLLACGCNELVQQSMQRIFGHSTSGRPVPFSSHPLSFLYGKH